MSDLNLKRFMKLIAFIACIAIAFALVVGKILDINKHPKYLLFSCDYMKRSYATYKVPKDFNILGLRFISNNLIDNNLILCNSFGDTVTGIWRFRYCGHLFECDDFGDGGNYGGQTIYLYEWDDTKKRYEEIGHV